VVAAGSVLAVGLSTVIALSWEENPQMTLESSGRALLHWAIAHSPRGRSDPPTTHLAASWTGQMGSRARRDVLRATPRSPRDGSMQQSPMKSVRPRYCGITTPCPRFSCASAIANASSRASSSDSSWTPHCPTLDTQSGQLSRTRGPHHGRRHL